MARKETPTTPTTPYTLIRFAPDGHKWHLTRRGTTQHLTFCGLPITPRGMFCTSINPECVVCSNCTRVAADGLGVMPIACPQDPTLVEYHYFATAAQAGTTAPTGPPLPKEPTVRVTPAQLRTLAQGMLEATELLVKEGYATYDTGIKLWREVAQATLDALKGQ